LVRLHGDEQPAVIPLVRHPIADRQAILGIIQIGEGPHHRGEFRLDASRGPLPFHGDECRRVGPLRKSREVLQLGAQQGIEQDRDQRALLPGKFAKHCH
jgi:hypothetical protein